MFDSIDVCDVKYLTSFDGDLFVLPLLSMDVPSAYDCSMDDMVMMCDNHLWCIMKVTNIQNNIGFFLRHFSCVGYL